MGAASASHATERFNLMLTIAGGIILAFIIGWVMLAIVGGSFQAGPGCGITALIACGLFLLWIL